MNTQTSSGQINKRLTGSWSYTNKEKDAETELQCITNTQGIKNGNTNPVVKDNNNSEINYFLPSPCQEVERRMSTKITKQLQKESKDVCFGIGLFWWLVFVAVKGKQQTISCTTCHVWSVLCKQPVKED